MPKFVGRNEELEQLEKTLDTVRAGVHRCVVISGEAGIGKSRLIAARAVDKAWLQPHKIWIGFRKTVEQVWLMPCIFF